MHSMILSVIGSVVLSHSDKCDQYRLYPAGQGYN